MNSTKRRVANADGSSYIIRSELTNAQDPDTEQTHIYLNLSIVNGNTDDAYARNPPQCVFNETRSTPIIEDASKYDISVVRFLATGTGRLLPLWIPTIDPIQDLPIDVNKTVYSVTVVNNFASPGTLAYSQQYLFWDPPDKSAPKPNSISPQDLSTNYYYANTYTLMVDMFNTAFQAACSDLSLTGFDPNFSGLSYDSITGLFTFNLQTDFYPADDLVDTLPTFSLWINAPLQNLLANFPGTFWNLSGGRTFRITPQRPYPTRGVIPDPAPAGTTYFGTTTQDFPSTNDVWTPIDSFCFTSTFIPLNPESSSAPVQVNNTNLGQNLATGQGFSNIIHDFCPNQTGGAEFGIGQLLYEPTAEYRIACMTAKQPVQAVDISMWWRYRLTGELIPLYMPPLASVSVKIMFRRKKWNSATK